ncbi:MAG: hypothetical protein ICV54_30675 [Nostoc sp. C3-bin3]|nr:hypothetical protein [Nostoc sp. C3-bin3]
MTSGVETGLSVPSVLDLQQQAIAYLPQQKKAQGCDACGKPYHFVEASYA